MLKTMKSYLTIPVLALSVLLMTACGGGGGGSDDTTPTGVSITTSNAVLIASKVIDSVSLVQDISDSVDLVTGVAIDSSGRDFTYSDLVLWLLAQNRQTAGLSGTETVTGVVIPETTYACETGTYTVSGDVSNPDVPTVGDTLTYTFYDCAISGIVFNGGMTFTITELSGSPSVSPYTLGVDIIMDNLSISSGGLSETSDGDMGILLTEDESGNEILTLSGNSFSATAGTQYETLTSYRYELSRDADGGYSIALNGTYGSDAIGGSVAFDTVTPFTGDTNVGDGNPTAGVLHIAAISNSSQERLTAQPDGSTVLIEVDANGDGIYEEVITTSWAALDSL